MKILSRLTYSGPARKNVSLWSPCGTVYSVFFYVFVAALYSSIVIDMGQSWSRWPAMSRMGRRTWAIFASLSQSKRSIFRLMFGMAFKKLKSLSAILLMELKVFSMMTPLSHSSFYSASLAAVNTQDAPPRDLPSKKTRSLLILGSDFANSSIASTSSKMPSWLGLP